MLLLSLTTTVDATVLVAFTVRVSDNNRIFTVADPTALMLFWTFCKSQVLHIYLNK